MRQLYLIVFYLLISIAPALSQRMVDVINQAEKAVVSVKSFSANGALLKEGSGCLLSADGIAIITAHCLYEGDSINITTRGDKRFGITTILQIHPQANLALVKLNTKARDLPFLIPSRPVFKEEQEVITFGHPTELDGGVEFGRIGIIGNFVYFNRFAQLPIKTSAKSSGAPVVNSRGELTGIVNAYDSKKNALLLDAKLLNDSNWVSVNKSYAALKKTAQSRAVFNPELNDGLLRLIANEYELAARSLSGYIRTNPTVMCAYILRSHARYMYKNSYGSREDLALIKKMNPNEFLPYYFEAQHLYADNKKEEALINYTICLEKKPDFAYALVERGRLTYLIKRNLEAAYADYVSAIAADSTYGAGYYERARFVLQHFEDRKSAVADIDNAIRLDPELPGVYTIRGTMHIEGQNYLPAINDFDKALKKDPTDSPALFNRGLANYNLGMKDKACSDWQKATNLGHYKAVKYISRYCGQRQ